MDWITLGLLASWSRHESTEPPKGQILDHMIALMIMQGQHMRLADEA